MASVLQDSPPPAQDPPPLQFRVRGRIYPNNQWMLGTTLHLCLKLFTEIAAELEVHLHHSGSVPNNDSVGNDTVDGSDNRANAIPNGNNTDHFARSPPIPQPADPVSRLMEIQYAIVAIQTCIRSNRFQNVISDDWKFNQRCEFSTELENALVSDSDAVLPKIADPLDAVDIVKWYKLEQPLRPMFLTGSVAALDARADTASSSSSSTSSTSNRRARLCKSTIARTLPIEILQRIMNHFSPGGNRPYSSDVVIKPEQKNLVACALVNRHWSSQAIPIIWTIPQLTSLEMLEKFTMSCLCNYMEECYGKRRSSLTRYVRELYVTYHFDTHDRLTVKEQWSGLECVRMVSKFLPELRNASVDLGEGCLGPLTLQSLLSWCPKINQLSNVIAGVETVLAPMAVPGYFGNLKKLITLDLGGTKYGPMMKTETGSMFLKAVAHNVGVNLRGIDLSDSPLTSEILYELCGNCPNLQVIDINSVVGLSPECLAMVPRMCPNLVAYIIFPNTGLTTEHIEMLFQSAPYLRMIDIESDALDARRVFEAIKKYSPKLSTISLGSCKLQEERDIIELIQERGPKLMDLQMGTQTMTEEIFVALGRYCPNLYSLELHADFVPTGSISYGSGISFMASACPDLRHLSVQDHEGNEDLFQHVTKGYRNCNFLNPVLDATFLGYPRFDQPPVGLVGDESADRMDLG